MVLRWCSWLHPCSVQCKRWVFDWIAGSAVDLLSRSSRFKAPDFSEAKAKQTLSFLLAIIDSRKTKSSTGGDAETRMSVARVACRGRMYTSKGNFAGSQHWQSTYARAHLPAGPSTPITLPNHPPSLPQVLHLDRGRTYRSEFVSPPESLMDIPETELRRCQIDKATHILGESVPIDLVFLIFQPRHPFVEPFPEPPPRHLADSGHHPPSPRLHGPRPSLASTSPITFSFPCIMRVTHAGAHPTASSLRTRPRSTARRPLPAALRWRVRRRQQGDARARAPVHTFLLPLGGCPPRLDRTVGVVHALAQCRRHPAIPICVRREDHCPLGLALVTATKRMEVPSLVLRVPRPTPSVSLRALSTTLVQRFESRATSEHEPTQQFFVGNVSFEATEADVRDSAAVFGEVESVRMRSTPTDRAAALDMFYLQAKRAQRRCLRREPTFSTGLYALTTPPHAQRAVGLPPPLAPSACGPLHPSGPRHLCGQPSFGTEEADDAYAQQQQQHNVEYEYNGAYSADLTAFDELQILASVSYLSHTGRTLRLIALLLPTKPPARILELACNLSLPDAARPEDPEGTSAVCGPVVVMRSVSRSGRVLRMACLCFFVSFFEHGDVPRSRSRSGETQPLQPPHAARLPAHLPPPPRVPALVVPRCAYGPPAAVRAPAFNNAQWGSVLALAHDMRCSLSPEAHVCRGSMSPEAGYVRAGSMGPESFVRSGSTLRDLRPTSRAADNDKDDTPHGGERGDVAHERHEPGAVDIDVRQCRAYRGTDAYRVPIQSGCEDPAVPHVIFTASSSSCTCAAVKDSPHFPVLEEAAEYTVACIRRNNLPQPACPFSTSLDAKNIDSPSARTSESVVDVVTEQGWLVLPRPSPCRRWPPYILSLCIRVVDETLRWIGTPNINKAPAALPIPDNTDADTELPTELPLSSTRGNDKHARHPSPYRQLHDAWLQRAFSMLTYHRSVNNTEWDGNGAAASDADACVAASADADACAPPPHHHPANNRPATLGMRGSSSSSYVSALEESYTAASNAPGSAGNTSIDNNNRRAYDDFGLSSPLGDDESDETTSGRGGRGATTRHCSRRTLRAGIGRARSSITADNRRPPLRSVPFLVARLAVHLGTVDVHLQRMVENLLKPVVAESEVVRGDASLGDLLSSLTLLNLLGLVRADMAW
ncbi:hypothetical protein B0H11DRAFT_2401342 [Mycena galericulata]|nr:hypothetical protein B0H11DRAFT_2401342 [Mycena galericulata]